MADKRYKLKDIPKGQKLAHIWDYYHWHIIVTVVGVFALVSLIFTVMNSPKYDTQILITANGAVFTEDMRADFNKGLASLNIDYDGNGVVTANIADIMFNENPMHPDVAQETQAYMNKLSTTLSVNEYVIQIADSERIKTLEANQTLTTYEELNGQIQGEIDKFEGEGYILIPYEDTVFNNFVAEERFMVDDLVVVIRPGKMNDSYYNSQIDLLRKITKK